MKKPIDKQINLCYTITRSRENNKNESEERAMNEKWMEELMNDPEYTKWLEERAEEAMLEQIYEVEAQAKGW